MMRELLTRWMWGMALIGGFALVLAILVAPFYGIVWAWEHLSWPWATVLTVGIGVPFLGLLLGLLMDD